MKKKVEKLFKVILIILIFINIISIHNNISYARYEAPIPITPTDIVEEETKKGTGVIENPDYWKPTNTIASKDLVKKVDVIVGLLNVVGVMVSVITLSIIGIKFITGSVEEKAQYKQRMVPWIIGALLIFAITTIPSLIYNMTNGMLK